jgi:hypothetical protein
LSLDSTGSCAGSPSSNNNRFAVSGANLDAGSTTVAAGTYNKLSFATTALAPVEDHVVP